MYCPFTKIKHILTFHPTSLERFLRASWGAVSQTAVLTVPQIKLNLQLSRCAFFYVNKTNILSIMCLAAFSPHLCLVFSLSCKSNALEFISLVKRNFQIRERCTGTELKKCLGLNLFYSLSSPSPDFLTYSKNLAWVEKYVFLKSLE